MSAARPIVDTIRAEWEHGPAAARQAWAQLEGPPDGRGRCAMNHGIDTSREPRDEQLQDGP